MHPNTDDGATHEKCNKCYTLRIRESCQFDNEEEPKHAYRYEQMTVPTRLRDALEEVARRAEVQDVHAHEWPVPSVTVSLTGLRAMLHDAFVLGLARHAMDQVR